MAEKNYQFEIPAHHKSIIKVIGVGGGGSNAVNHMFNLGIKDVEFVVCNTDAQALKSSPVPTRLQLGTNLTAGLGAGANPEVGKNAALENKEDLRDLLSDDTRMVFVTAGMGGGTGTGAAPVIAKVAKELEILTVGIVTMPFGFEGKKKMTQANLGLEALKECCDTVLVIMNDKLREVFGNLSISSAFAKADNVLTTAAKGIAEIITVPGYVNVDFEDVKTVMRDSGAAVMGSAQTEGENRARRAAEEALSSPLLNNQDIQGAQKILLSIISGDQAELQMDELTEITEFIQEMAGDEAEVIFGHGLDADLGDSIRVTVIATGFEQTDPLRTYKDKVLDKRKVIDLESNRQITLFDEQQQARAKANNNEGTPPPINPDKGYTFEGGFTNNQPEPEEEPQPVRRYDLGDLGDEFHVEEEEPVINNQAQPAHSPEAFEHREDELKRKRMERVERIKKLNDTSFERGGDFKEKLEKPAYMRKNVKLGHVPHSSENNVSRYNLNDDNQILGNNKFLHDNVD